MNRSAAGERVSRARTEVTRAELEVAIARRSWREGLAHHRAAALIGSGMLAGLAVAGISPRNWSRAGAWLLNAGALLTRSALAPAILSALLVRRAGTPATKPLRTGAGAAIESAGETP